MATALAFSALVFISAIVIACFSLWRRRELRRLIDGATRVDTAKGIVEYVVVGGGPPVIMLHGGAGGWDQGVMLGESIGIPEHFRMIAVSRPGYLGTPLSCGETHQQAADAVIALMDALGIAKAAVVGVSGGGPTALQAAVRHPDRVTCLLMASAISRRHTQPKRSTSGLARLIFVDPGPWLLDLGIWFLNVLTWYAPRLFARQLMAATELLSREEIHRRANRVLSDPDRLFWMRRLIATISPLSPRKTGLDNDLKQFAQLPDSPTEPIRVPTMAIHGRLDGNVPFDHAESTASRASEATIHAIADGGHLLWLSGHTGEVRDVVVSFLIRHRGER